MTRKRKNLTEREKKVLCALVRYPMKKDRDIAGFTGLHLSTVTAIRRRLYSSKFYDPMMIPRVKCLGAELFTVGYGAINTTIPREERDEVIAKCASSNPRIILSLTSDDFALMALVNRNYTELKRDVNEIEELFGVKKVTMREPLRFVTLSYKISSFVAFLDYSYTVHRLLCGEDIEPRIDIKQRPYKMRALTKKEASALTALVENPTLSIGSIAKAAEMSRQTLALLRARFLKEGLVRQINLPNMMLLGCGIMTFTHAFLNSGSPLEERKKGIELILRETPVTILASGNTESVLIHFFKNYEEFNTAKNKIITFYMDHDFLKSTPKITLIPMESIRVYKNLAYPALLRYLLSKTETVKN